MIVNHLKTRVFRKISIALIYAYLTLPQKRVLLLSDVKESYTMTFSFVSLSSSIIKIRQDCSMRRLPYIHFLIHRPHSGHLFKKRNCIGYLPIVLVPEREI